VSTQTAPRQLQLRVDGMHCGACEKLVSMNAGKIDGVVSVKADAEAGSSRSNWT
jgi:copper chaperone CopZ